MGESALFMEPKPRGVDVTLRAGGANANDVVVKCRLVHESRCAADPSKPSPKLTSEFLRLLHLDLDSSKPRLPFEGLEPKRVSSKMRA
mmetsp:Transcript_1491/g.4080  ORF Transcript_1491/g.4080 Transcript_1491/m.4080 type:complete len:88 (+) Transcript_1491:333-596(+)